MSLVEEVTVLDFETFAIQPRPMPAPEPVGLAIRHPNGDKEYLAFAHKNGTNNATKQEAYNALIKAYRGPVVFHNAKFDVDVARIHFGLPYPRQYHDTMFLAFLNCPHAPSFALKATAERVLAMPPSARDAVHEWILANIPMATLKNAGAFICEAPVDLVAPYAMADVEMTFRLFACLHPAILMAGMEAAYIRELRLMPNLLEAEIRGVRVDRAMLTDWHTRLQRGIGILDTQIGERLGCPGLVIDEDKAVADAIDRAGLVADWILTPTGQRATNKKAMLRQCSDPHLLRMLGLRNTAATMLRSFVSTWLDASAVDGRLHTQWNQTRSIDNTGTKTGRIGSERPNLANVPNASATYPELPNLRSAFLPEEGDVWMKADFSQQEFRLAAHFEGGAIMRAYQNNPDIDFHQLTSDLVKLHANMDLPRKIIKNVNFCMLYGGGVQRLSEVLGCDIFAARAVRDAYYTALPGLKQLSQMVQQVSVGPRGGVRTLGGRHMPTEPPKYNPKTQEMQTYAYKQLNKLAQGSAADMTKQAIVAYSCVGSPAPMLLTVYDEIDVSCPPHELEWVKKTLNDCMVNAIPCDVPMRVDISHGATWGDLA